MVNQQLVDYIKAQLAAGSGKLDIQKALTGAGWPLLEVNAAFAATESKPVLAAKPPIIVQAQPIQPIIQTQPQTKPLPVIHMHPPGGILRSAWFWALVVLLLLIVAGAAAYFLTPVGTMIRDYFNPPAPPVVTTIPPITEQTYTDSTYGFSVTYPGNLSRLPNSKDEVFVLPNFSVSATTSPKSVASCLTSVQEVGTTTINGTEFTTQVVTTTAINTTTNIYNTVHAGACVTLEVFDPSVAPILQSFRFVATSTGATASTTVAQ